MHNPYHRYSRRIGPDHYHCIRHVYRLEVMEGVPGESMGRFSLPINVNGISRFKWICQGTSSRQANLRTWSYLGRACIGYGQRWPPCNHCGVGRRDVVGGYRVYQATWSAFSNRYHSTSPSIYAGFTSIGAYDSCGGDVISTTMLSFAPGELSTVVGPCYFGNIAATTLPFDFVDLVSRYPRALTAQDHH